LAHASLIAPDLQASLWYWRPQGDVGVSIGCRIPSSSEDAKSLRAELYAMGKHPRRIDVGGRTYELRCQTYDSFGEDAFEVKIRRL
jgi:hypothetical protein